jgi:L-ectoine synthase
MLIRTTREARTVEWGNGTSCRLLVEADGVGYSVTDTLVRAGTRSPLQYRNHLEACYCIDGSGEVIESTGVSHRIEPGVLYALDQHDPHILAASPDEDMRLICMFTPALRGDEVHDVVSESFSAY